MLVIKAESTLAIYSMDAEIGSEHRPPNAKGGRRRNV